MTMRVLFNGVVLVKPGGATKVDASAFSGAALAGVGTIGMVGEAEAGEPNAVHIFSRSDAQAKYFRTGPLADAAGPAFRSSGDPRISAGANAVVAIKANQAMQASKTLQGSGVAQATLSGIYLTPINIFANGGNTGSVLIEVNSAPAGPGASFAATQASLLGVGGTFALASGEVMTVKADSGLTQTVTFGVTEASAADYVATINSQLLGVFATVDTGQIRITSDGRGTKSKFEVLTQTAGLAAKLGFGLVTANQVGSTVFDGTSITAAEIISIIQSAYPGVTVTTGTGQVITITSNLVGPTSSLKILAGATANGFGLPTFPIFPIFTAAGAVNVMVLTAKEWGALGNLISEQVSDSGGGKLIQFTFNDPTNPVVKTENSPILGAVGKLSVTYIGDAGTATITVNATGITTALSGQTDGSANLNIPFVQYKSVQDIVNFINAQFKYSATAVSVNPFADLGVDLDYMTGTNLLSTVTLFGKLMDVVNWINQNSSLVTATRVVNGPAAPYATVQAYLAGGIRGTSNNTNWQDSFNLMGTVRVNQVVPLISFDLGGIHGDGLGSTAEVDVVNAQADAHATYYSSTAGKSERQAFLSKRGNKLQIKAAAQLLNSFNSCLCGVQKPSVLTEAGFVVQLPEYIQAVVAASMRSGAELGEPLTFKFVRYSDLETDPSWSPALDAAEMILAGVMFVEQVPAQGFRWVKAITTYTRTDNDAYTEESVVQGWKNVAYELRTHLETLFTGTRATPSNIATVKEQASAKLELLKKAGQIVDSVLPDGQRLNAYRNLNVYTLPGMPDAVAIDVTVSPVSGINFTLNTLTLVPAQISV